MPTMLSFNGLKVQPRTSRRQQLLFTREELRQLLNEDLRRERKARCALAVLVARERDAGRHEKAERIDQSRRLVAMHASNLEKVLLDIDGRLNADVDELNAILGAERVLDPLWCAETIRNLHERARQLRTAGFSGLAKRVMRIVSEKARDANNHGRTGA